MDFSRVENDVGNRFFFDDCERVRSNHHLFRYPAKFHAPVAQKLIEKFSANGELLLDPFCGSGTLMVEALRLGRDSIGLDVDPLAAFVSRVKTLSIPTIPLRRSSSKLLDKLAKLERSDDIYLDLTSKDIPTSEFEQELRSRQLAVPLIPNIGHWFRRYVIIDLATILSQIRALEIPKKHRDFLLLIFASTIRKASNADPIPVSGLEVTSHMRKLEKRGRYINPFKLFKRVLNRGLEDWAEYQALRSASCGTVSVFQGDAMRLRKYVRHSIDTIITSPPYHQAIDYYRRHTLEMYWLGLVSSHDERLQLRSHYIGRHRVSRSDMQGLTNAHSSPFLEEWETKLRNQSSDRAMDFRHYVSSMAKCIAGMSCVLKLGGKAVFVIGNNRTSKGMEIPSIEIFNEIATAHLQLQSLEWYPVKNRYMTYTRRNGANIDKEYVLVYEKTSI